ncbi:MAG: hypothetical protein PWP31_150 [Clostridia bacterium]|nr:hypothetical protein [Clostridia bacterium]
MDRIIRIVALISYLLGTIVVIEGIKKYFKSDSNIPIYLVMAIIIVGPVEDLLNDIINNKEMTPQEQEFYIQLINQITSIAFLILLWLSIYES